MIGTWFLAVALAADPYAERVPVISLAGFLGSPDLVGSEAVIRPYGPATATLGVGLGLGAASFTGRVGFTAVTNTRERAAFEFVLIPSVGVRWSSRHPVRLTEAVGASVALTGGFVYDNGWRIGVVHATLGATVFPPTATDDVRIWPEVRLSFGRGW